MRTSSPRAIPATTRARASLPALALTSMLALALALGSLACGKRGSLYIPQPTSTAPTQSEPSPTEKPKQKKAGATEAS